MNLDIWEGMADFVRGHLVCNLKGNSVPKLKSDGNERRQIGLNAVYTDIHFLNVQVTLAFLNRGHNEPDLLLRAARRFQRCQCRGSKEGLSNECIKVPSRWMLANEVIEALSRKIKIKERKSSAPKNLLKYRMRSKYSQMRMNGHGTTPIETLF